MSSRRKWVEILDANDEGDVDYVMQVMKEEKELAEIIFGFGFGFGIENDIVHEKLIRCMLDKEFDILRFIDAVQLLFVSRDEDVASFCITFVKLFYAKVQFNYGNHASSNVVGEDWTERKDFRQIPSAKAKRIKKLFAESRRVHKEWKEKIDKEIHSLSLLYSESKSRYAHFIINEFPTFAMIMEEYEKVFGMNPEIDIAPTFGDPCIDFDEASVFWRYKG